MNSAIFSTANEAYQVSNIRYAGSISEIPEDRRKGENTHSFKLVTSLGASFCHYKSQDAALKARKVLGAMMGAAKGDVIRHGGQTFDPRSIISFGKVVSLKKPQGEHTHAVVATIECADERDRKVWLTYKSEENAQKGRKALFAKVYSVNRLESEAEKTADEASREPIEQGVTVTEDLPF